MGVDNPQLRLEALADNRFTDMFRSLNASSLEREHIFAVTVGASSKQTLAQWHLLEPADVISSLALLNGQADGGSLGAVAVLDRAATDSRL